MLDRSGPGGDWRVDSLSTKHLDGKLMKRVVYKSCGQVDIGDFNEDVLIVEHVRVSQGLF